VNLLYSSTQPWFSCLLTLLLLQLEVARMRKITYLCVALLLSASLSFGGAAKAGTKTFVGNISDSMCGLKHMMPGKSDKECTVECCKSWQ